MNVDESGEYVRPRHVEHPIRVLLPEPGRDLRDATAAYRDVQIAGDAGARIEHASVGEDEVRLSPLRCVERHCAAPCGDSAGQEGVG